MWSDLIFQETNRDNPGSWFVAMHLVPKNLPWSRAFGPVVVLGHYPWVAQISILGFVYGWCAPSLLFYPSKKKKKTTKNLPSKFFFMNVIGTTHDEMMSEIEIII